MGSSTCLLSIWSGLGGGTSQSVVEKALLWVVGRALSVDRSGTLAVPGRGRNTGGLSSGRWIWVGNLLGVVLEHGEILRRYG